MKIDQLEINHRTECGAKYIITFSYAYKHRPEVLRSCPYDSYDDESELTMNIVRVDPEPSNGNLQEITDDFRDGPLYGRASDKAIDNYFEE